MGEFAKLLAKKNIGAKVLSVKLAKVLNVLITSLNTCLGNDREHVAKSREKRQKTTNRGNRDSR